MKKERSVTMRIYGDEPEVIAFIRLCGIIQNLGNIGASRTIKLDVDGDGSCRMRFELVEGDRVEKVPTPQYNSDGSEIKLGLGE